jgi:hypothetical protein
MNGLKDHQIRELVNYTEKEVSVWISKNIGIKIPGFKLHQCFRNVIHDSIVGYLKQNDLRLDWKEQSAND